MRQRRPLPCEVADLDTWCSNPQSESLPSSESSKEPRPVLRRLTLNVANACNLACKYCYANCGSYYSSPSLMDEVTALAAVNYARRRFSRIDHVSFFGGEPTLNHRTILTVCEYFAYLRARGLLNQMPQFGLTTNGYALGKDILRILERHEFSVSFSLDGPREIHDRLRVSQCGAPTWSAVAENVDRVRTAGIVPEFECTYTAEHWRMGITVVDLLEFFHFRFDCHILHCPVVLAPRDSPWLVPLDIASGLYADAIRESVRNVASGVPKSISLAMRMMRAIANTRPIYHYCPAGTATITVNPDGYVYACFMLMAGQKFAIGNVNETHSRGVPGPILRLLENADKWSNAECCQCWAQPLCFGCIGDDLARDCRKEMCEFKREQIEACLDAMAAHLPSIQRSSMQPVSTEVG
jgi:uncharacterized protein